MYAWRNIFVVLLTIAFSAVAAFGTAEKPDVKIDAGGTWRWNVQRRNGAGREVTLKLKQDGEKLTGSVTGFAGNDNDIQEGTIKDGVITFKVVNWRNGMDVTTTYTGKYTGDKIQGRMETDMGGGPMSVQWNAERVKEKEDAPPKDQ